MNEPRIDFEKRRTEAMLWRAAWAMSGDEAVSDGALAAVHGVSARPNAASESRLLRVLVEAVRATGIKGPPADDAETARRLIETGAVPTDVVEHALEIEVGAIARDPAARGADDAMVAAALGRVDVLTAGLRRRRAALNALKFAVFFGALLTVVYVMFDLRKAADAERARRTPADVYSLPMPKKEGTGR
ncbi:MAG: hypothetical protein ACKVZJ_09050 [Phycisphaerales bacterium]